MTDLEQINERLENAAYKITQKFCYGCYKVIDGDHCPTCGTDDFMRHLEGVGVEYGVDWVIDHLIETRLNPVDGDEYFADMLDECYPEIVIGCCSFYPSQVMKELDPTAFNIGVTEYLDGMVEDGTLYEHNGDYYNMDDLENMLDEIEYE